MQQLFHFGDDFNAMRDDAHMAAWQPLQIDGAAWEAFAYIYNGQATSAVELAPHLARRGYTQREYAAFLELLAARGWLRANGDRYEVAEAGRQIRAQVEAQTDAYFAIPWAAISTAEYSEVAALLTQLRDELLEVGRR
jgi:hypothetical protein